MNSHFIKCAIVVVLLTGSSLMAAGDHGSGGLMSPNPGLAFWTIVTFFTTLAILRASAWKPLMQNLQAREKGIRDAIESAQKAKQEAESLLKQYQEKMASAQAEIKATIQEGQKAAQVQKETMIKEATEECQRIRERSENDIRLAKEKAMQEIFKVAADLSVAISTKLIQKSLDSNEQNRIIQETLNQFQNADIRKN